MIRVTEMKNWNTTRAFLKKERLVPMCKWPFKTLIGLNEER